MPEGDYTQKLLCVVVSWDQIIKKLIESPRNCSSIYISSFVFSRLPKMTTKRGFIWLTRAILYREFTATHRPTGQAGRPVDFGPWSHIHITRRKWFCYGLREVFLWSSALNCSIGLLVIRWPGCGPPCEETTSGCTLGLLPTNACTGEGRIR